MHVHVRGRVRVRVHDCREEFGESFELITGKRLTEKELSIIYKVLLGWGFGILNLDVMRYERAPSEEVDVFNSVHVLISSCHLWALCHPWGFHAPIPFLMNISIARSLAGGIVDCFFWVVCERMG